MAACILLSKSIAQLVASYLTSFKRKIEKGDAELDQLSRYQNYKTALLLGGSKISLTDPFGHLMAGYKTGITESVRIVLESWRAYEHQMSTAIDLSTLEEIARNSTQLLKKIASTHMRIFANYTVAVNGCDAYQLNPSHDPTLFEIKGTSPSRYLDMSENLIHKIEGEYFATDDKEFFGCPALFSKGIKHADVVTDMFQSMVIPASLHYLKPIISRQR